MYNAFFLHWLKFKFIWCIQFIFWQSNTNVLVNVTMEPILIDQLNWKQNKYFFFKLRLVWISLKLKRVWYSTLKSSIPGLVISNEASLWLIVTFLLKILDMEFRSFQEDGYQGSKAPNFFWKPYDHCQKGKYIWTKTATVMAMSF